MTLTFFLYVSVGNKTVSTRGPEIRVTNVVISIVWMRFTILKCPINSHKRKKNCLKAISSRRGRFLNDLVPYVIVIRPQSPSRNAPLRRAGFRETTEDESVCDLCRGIRPSKIWMEIGICHTSFYNSIALLIGTRYLLSVEIVLQICSSRIIFFLSVQYLSIADKLGQLTIAWVPAWQLIFLLFNCPFQNPCCSYMMAKININK